MTVYPVILCGGTGNRLWPLSRQSMPKQFVALWSQKTCFQETVIRACRDCSAEPIVVTCHDYRFLVDRQLQELGVEATVLLEPEGRNTGPAILAAAAWLQAKDPNTVMAILPADQRIDGNEAFHSALAAAHDSADQGKIVTFGIKPDRPEPGYGYIKPGPADNQAARPVETFVEKPERQTAEGLIQDGYLWNSGIFLVRSDTALEEYRAARPLTVAAVEEAVGKASEDLDFHLLDRRSFCRAEALSFDHAVMETTKKAAVLPVSFAWSDIGSWNALWELADKSGDGNIARGPVETIDVRNCYIDSHADHITALLGVEDLIVVAAPDAVLVADRSRADDIGLVVDQLAKSGRLQAEEYDRVDRPWGWYETLHLEDGCQIRRVIVYPGGRLSLQKHHHRSEHWIVIRGSATVAIGEETSNLRQGESVHVPTESNHRLENRGDRDLEIVEVQTGSKLAEEDIVLLDDIYGQPGQE